MFVPLEFMAFVVHPKARFGNVLLPSSASMCCSERVFHGSDGKNYDEYTGARTATPLLLHPMRGMRCGLVVLSFCIPMLVSAFYIHLHGVVTEYFTGDAMKGVQIRVVKDSIDRETIFTPGSGKYEVYLERGYNYEIWFHRSDLVTKYVRIDAREVPLFPDVPFYDMDLQMTLFTWLEGYDFSLFLDPVGLAQYKHSVRNLNWDIEYTSSIRRLIDRFMVHYEREMAERSRSQAHQERRRRRTVKF